jgi:CRISPR-associated protein Csx3
MSRLLPAVLIGGPPHINKAMLFSALTKALRERHILHHAIRVCSDGQDVLIPTDEQAYVRLLSIRDIDGDELVGRLDQDLSRRLLPMLIDISVDHQYLQHCILKHSTHLIFPPYRYDQANQDLWCQLEERYGLLPLLDTCSSFESSLSATITQEPVIPRPLLRSEKNFVEHEPFFGCAVERITNLFSTYSNEELMNIHLHQAPGELTLHLSMLLQTLAPGAKSWEPHMLPAVLEYLPARASLSVYGPGPQWLYAALAAYANDFFQFNACFLPGDVSSGWVASPPLLLSTTTRPEVQVTYIREDKNSQLTVNLSNFPFDYLQAPSLPFPPVPSHLGLTLVGSMPTWLLTAIVRLYTHAGVPWIACRQPQQCRDVVVFSQTPQHFVGESIFVI